MRALVQRVKEAELFIDGKSEGPIGVGLLIYLGIGHEDDEAVAEKLWNKIKKLRIFADDEGKINLDIGAVSGNLLIVSQFTLYASVRKGNRPSFTSSADPEKGKALYDYFVNLARAEFQELKTGTFGANMQVESINDGPFTIWIDSEDLARPGRG